MESILSFIEYIIVSFIVFIINFIYNFLSQSGDFLNILGMIGMAFLTILIPISIVIFNNERDFNILDRNIVLDGIIKAKYFLYYLVAIFLPLLLWEVIPIWARILALIVWISGVYYMSRILVGLYNWIKEEKFTRRFKYLKNLKKTKDTEESWRSVWELEKINWENEEEFFKIFYSDIDNLIENKKNSEILSKLIEDFNNFIDNRSIIFLIISEEFFPKILEWHLIIWKKDKENTAFYYKTLSSLNSIFQKIEERALREGRAFSFFDKFEKHIEEHKKEFISNSDNKKVYYIKPIMNIFFLAFVKNIKNSSERYDIWESYFPPKWKITKENKKDNNNIVSVVLLDIFLNWMLPRLQELKEINKHDEDLDEITFGLFPSVEPILAAKLFTLLGRSWENNNRMKSLIEQNINFGYHGRIMFGRYEFGKDPEKEFYEQQEKLKNNTLELFLLLFSQEFTKEKLNSFISELNKLKYNNETEEERRRKNFISIFEEIIALLKSKKNQNNKL